MLPTLKHKIISCILRASGCSGSLKLTNLTYRIGRRILAIQVSTVQTEPETLQPLRARFNQIQEEVHNLFVFFAHFRRLIQHL